MLAHAGQGRAPAGTRPPCRFQVPGALRHADAALASARPPVPGEPHRRLLLGGSLTSMPEPMSSPPLPRPFGYDIHSEARSIAGPICPVSPVTCGITVSVDGFAAGPRQSLGHPLGEGGDWLHRWMFEQPQANADEIAALTSASAYIMGRNMFGPGRGAWDDDWRGWWGEEPPYHAPVFVLSHHPRDLLTMQGGITFTFVTDGIQAALARARGRR